MDEGSAVFMFKSIAMGFDSILMMDFKPLPMPTVVQCPFIVHHPGDVLKHAVQGARKSQLTELREAFFDKGVPTTLSGRSPSRSEMYFRSRRRNGKPKTWSPWTWVMNTV